MTCPNVDCENHNQGISKGPKWYIRHGLYTTKRLKHKIQRFKCKKCGKTFSIQTFSVDYYVHITIDYKELEKLNVAFEKIGDMARQNRQVFS